MDGVWFYVPASAASLTFGVGQGFEYWVTRDADGFSSPHFTAPAASNSDLHGPLFDIFPDPPQRAQVETKHFRVHNENRGGHSFTVRMSDGYSDLLPSRLPD